MTEQSERPTASERLAAALGRPPARALSPDELREFEAAQDRADDDAARIYQGHTRAA